MEASHLAGRCARRSIRKSNYSCTQVNLFRQSSPANQRSSRPLSTTARRTQDKPAPQPQPATRNVDLARGLDFPAATNITDASAAQSSQRPTQYQRRLQRTYTNPGPADRIDLSTLPGVKEANPDYKPPPRKPISQESAAAKLQDMFARNAKDAALNLRSSSNPFRRANTPLRDDGSSDASTDNLGSTRPGSTFGGNLDAYTRPNARPLTRSPFDASKLLDNLSFTSSLTGPGFQARQIPLRLRPTLGRTVAVVPQTGFDLSRAFRSLELKCNANSVRKDERNQKFHVRRGQERKLKRSARWRILFKKGFLNEVARIQRMRAQGW